MIVSSTLSESKSYAVVDVFVNVKLYAWKLVTHTVLECGNCVINIYIYLLYVCQQKYCVYPANVSFPFFSCPFVVFFSLFLAIIHDCENHFFPFVPSKRNPTLAFKHSYIDPKLWAKTRMSILDVSLVTRMCWYTWLYSHDCAEITPKKTWIKQS